MSQALTTFRAHLEELVRLSVRPERKGKPAPAERPVDRTLLRRFLLALGTLLEEQAPETLEEDLARARAAIAALGQRWTATLTGEMELACGEHVQGVDPRYLSHARYDFEYALAARQRLEQRLEALDALQLAVDEGLLEGVARADELLAEALERRET